jgi:hypothetical protein
VYVSTVDQLYAAVNDPANSDTLVVLAPGIYTLSSAAPNGGSLVLQPHTDDFTGNGPDGD